MKAGCVAHCALVVAALSLAGCPEWPHRPPCPMPTCTTKASMGGFYLDPAQQGKKTRVWVLEHMTAMEEGKQLRVEDCVESAQLPDEGEPASGCNDYGVLGEEPYLPVHIGWDEGAAGKGARVVQIDLKVNTEFVVLVTNDEQLPRDVARGKVEAVTGKAPAEGISPLMFVMPVAQWWSTQPQPEGSFWYTDEHVQGRIWLVRTGDPPEDDVYRAIGAVSALFRDQSLVGCHHHSYRFVAVD